MKKDKKSQATGKIFIFIFAAVVAVLILIIGYRSIGSISEKSFEAEFTRLKVDMKNDMATLMTEYGSIQRFSYKVPEIIEKVCFADITMKDPNTIGNKNIQEFPLIKDNVESGLSNVFFILREKAPVMENFGPIKISNNARFACFDVEDGSLEMNMEGAGRSIIILKEFVSSLDIPAGGTIGRRVLGSADNVMSLTIPAGTRVTKNNQPVTQISIELIPLAGIYGAEALKTELYKFKPDGARFSNPIKLTMEFYPEAMDGCPESLVFYQHDDQGTLKAKIDSESIDCEENTVTFLIDSFSSGGVGPDDPDIVVGEDYTAGDADGDGASNDIDECPDTPSDEIADSVGCSCTQKYCFDDNPCTDDECDAGTGECIHVNDDSKFCGAGKVCRDGLCLDAEGEAILPVCGNSVCEEGEDYTTCPEDCPSPAVCGNQICERGETFDNCPDDCPKPEEIDLMLLGKASDRSVITDIASWNGKLYYGTTDHSSCDEVGEVYEYPCALAGDTCTPIGDYDYFDQEGMKNVRYGNNNILVPGLDPETDNKYELFVYDGSWNRHKIKEDPGGHLVDAVYFDGKYFVLTNYGFIVVKYIKDYGNEGSWLNFEADTYEQKIELGVAKPTSLTVWNDVLYILGPKQMDCNPKTDPDCEVEYFVWRYYGEGSVEEYDLIPYNVNFGMSDEFKGDLFVVGSGGGLYKTSNGVDYDVVEFFEDFVPSSEEESRQISDIAVLGNKIYVSVMVGKFGIPGTFICNEEEMSLSSALINGYEIYSSGDGGNWNKVYNKSVFVKNYPDVRFPMEPLDGKLYVGMSESVEYRGKAFLFTNLYVYEPEIVCGDGICGEGETAADCPEDCGGRAKKSLTLPACGDDVCEDREDYTTCPEDCPSPAVCGNGICEEGETAADCPEDCGEEVCDGVDNNNNGLIDEELTRSCYDGPTETLGIVECTNEQKASKGGCESGEGTWFECNKSCCDASGTCIDEYFDGTGCLCPFYIEEVICPVGGPCPEPEMQEIEGPENGCVCEEALGECKSGFQICENGEWSECHNQILPATEICDGLDNNCDGGIDSINGVQLQVVNENNRQSTCENGIWVEQGCLEEEDCSNGLDSDCDGLSPNEDYDCVRRGSTEPTCEFVRVGKEMRAGFVPDRWYDPVEHSLWGMNPRQWTCFVERLYPQEERSKCIAQKRDWVCYRNDLYGFDKNILDWHDYIDGNNWMTPVKEQNHPNICGSCWAYSALGALEAQYSLAFNDPNLNLDLAEQYLLSCSGAGSCETGGNNDQAIDYIKKTGILAEECFQYAATDAPCSGFKCDTNYLIYGYDKIEGYDAIKRTLRYNGPLSVCLDWNLQYIGTDRIGKCPAVQESGGHCVTLVGYNDDKEYWIIKNSYGLGYFDGGYGKIGYGECRIETTRGRTVLIRPVPVIPRVMGRIR